MLTMWTKQWLITFLLAFWFMNVNDQFMLPCQVWAMVCVLWMWIALWLVHAHFGPKLHWLFSFLVLCNLTWLWAQLKSLLCTYAFNVISLPCTSYKNHSTCDMKAIGTHDTNYVLVDPLESPPHKDSCHYVHFYNIHEDRLTCPPWEQNHYYSLSIE
jgi:hypothetical protein